MVDIDKLLKETKMNYPKELTQLQEQITKLFTEQEVKDMIEKALAEKPQEEYKKVMDSAGISMLIVSSKEIEDLGYNFFEGRGYYFKDPLPKEKAIKEPPIDFNFEGVYNVEYLRKAFFIFNQLGVTYLMIKQKDKDQPLCLEAHYGDDKRIVKFYLAPYVEE